LPTDTLQETNHTPISSSCPTPTVPARDRQRAVHHRAGKPRTRHRQFMCGRSGSSRPERPLPHPGSGRGRCSRRRRGD
jgi:hypothetical protein